MSFESILSITELNSYVKSMISSNATLQELWVKGEISNLVQHRSGHTYFTLKDASSQIACTMFKSSCSLLKFKFEDGLRVIVRGGVDLYLPRGQYQLNVVYAMPDGVGALYLAFEQLKKKLERDGLFDIARKRQIPERARKIGVATSPEGEALRDIIAVIKRRNPDVEIYLAPATVQGEGAADSIARSVELLNKINLDVIIVGRGGGSIEDLWAFNEEIVARAICCSSIPVVSAVGHEGDFTIADLVADVRAPTPSAAAEMVVKDRKMLLKEVEALMERLHYGAENLLLEHRRNLREKIERLDPGDLLLNQHYQKVDELAMRLQFSIEHKIEMQKQVLCSFESNLKALSPLNVIERGYSLAIKQDGEIVRSSDDVRSGELIKILVSDGEIHCRVERKEEGTIWKKTAG